MRTLPVEKTSKDDRLIRASARTITLQIIDSVELIPRNAA
jgi:hypothetical protein